MTENENSDLERPTDVDAPRFSSESRATEVDAVPPFMEPEADSRGMMALVGAAVAWVLLLGGLCFSVLLHNKAAAERLDENEGKKSNVALADQAEEVYCTPQFKEVLERVIHACGLDSGSSRRGCKPSDVRSLASISDADFNALFTPLKERGAVLLFDNASEELDESAKELLESTYAERRGARYFFVVARASKSGSVEKNRSLSHRRANSVAFHLASVTQDPEIQRHVGQLWLGNEFAQLSKDFCDWPSSRPDGQCSLEAINRSVFASWVDCRL